MATLKLLSAGAVKRGVTQIAEAYARSSGNIVEVEFTQVHKIRKRFRKGCPVKLVAPLPEVIQNISTYHAAAVAASPHPAGAGALVRELTTPAAKQIFAATGID